MNAYDAEGSTRRIETACVMPSSVFAAHFGGESAMSLAKRRTLAQHLAKVGAAWLVAGYATLPFDGEPFVTRWLDATYADGSVGGVWISERAA